MKMLLITYAHQLMQHHDHQPDNVDNGDDGGWAFVLRATRAKIGKNKTWGVICTAPVCSAYTNIFLHWLTWIVAKTHGKTLLLQHYLYVITHRIPPGMIKSMSAELFFLSWYVATSKHDKHDKLFLFVGVQFVFVQKHFCICKFFCPRWGASLLRDWSGCWLLSNTIFDSISSKLNKWRLGRRRHAQPVIMVDSYDNATVWPEWYFVGDLWWLT